MFDIKIKKQELIDEFNALETRQREIIGALKLLEEQEKELNQQEEKEKPQKEK